MLDLQQLLFLRSATILTDRELPMPCLLFGLSLVLAAPELPVVPWGGADFIQYYVAAESIRQGRNPYDLEEAARRQTELGRVGPPLEVYGPPTCLLPYLSLGYLSFPTAVAVHLAVSTFLLAACAFVWSRWFLRGRGVLPLLCSLAAAPIWLPVLNVLGMGQNTVLVLAGFTGAISCVRRGRDLLGGFLLALVTVKPHLGAALIVFFVAWAARHRRYLVFAGLGGTIGLAILKVSLIRAPLWGEYIAFLHTAAPPAHYYSATLDGWGRLHFGEGFRVLSWGLWVASIAAAAWLGWRQPLDGPDQRAAAAVLTVAVVGVPHAFSYDFVLLLPVFLVSVAAAVVGASRAGGSQGGGTVLLAAVLLAIGRGGHWPEWAYWTVPWLMLVPAGCLLLAASKMAQPANSASAAQPLREAARTV
jgi:hypothetical protein